MISVLSV